MQVVNRIGKTLIDATLVKVLLVPQLATNLLSIGASAEKGIITIFKDQGCVMKRGTKTLATGRKFDKDLYLLDLTVRKPEGSKALMIQTGRTMEEWHHALGHANKDTIQKLVQNKEAGIQVLGRSEGEPCGACAAGKAKHVTHPQVIERAQEVGESVHLDLSGKVNKVSISGDYYFLLCKDEASEYTFVYPIQTKDQVVRAINKLLIEFEIESGRQIRTLKSDCGSEFKNRRVEEYLDREHVKQEFTAPYTPKQNGIIEREMQTTVSMARTMLLASGLDKSLWAEAIRAATYIRNNLPTKRSALTPTERFKKQRPRVEHLVAWGRPVQVCNNVSYLRKFDSRTVEGYIVGYTRRRNTYRVYLKQEKRVIETSDVIFKPHMTGANQLAPEVSRGPEVTQIEFVEPEGPQMTNRESTHQKNNSGEIQPDCQSDPSETADQGQSTDAPAQGHEEPGQPSEWLEGFIENFRHQEKHNKNQTYDILPGTRTPPQSPRCRCPEPMKTPPRPRYTSQCGQAHNEGGDVGRALVSLGAGNHNVPLTLDEALTGNNSQDWSKAIKEELEAHTSNQTWEVVERPHGRHLLTAKWVFTNKYSENGDIVRRKARLVARGFSQRPGLDFDETYAPVAAIQSIRTLVAIAIVNNWVIERFDVKTAFLHGEIEEDVLMEPPEGMVLHEEKCLKLNKALYGLKQAPRAWNSKITEVLRELSLLPTLTDSSVYISTDKLVILALYVDDGLIISPSQEKCLELINMLDRNFPTKKTVGPFLGMKMTRGEETITLSQQTYIERLLVKFQMDSAKPVSAPLIHQTDLIEGEELGAPFTGPYQELLGALQYLAQVTRPDILYATNFLSRFNKAPMTAHWIAAKRILRYLKGTMRKGLTYEKKQLAIEAYSDANWGGDQIDRRSTSGGIILLAGGPITYFSRKQTNIATSTTESEYVAASEAAKEITGLLQFLRELGISVEQTTLKIDNASTIKQIKNGESKRNKHVDIKYHHVRERYLANDFVLEDVESKEQLADYLTKPLCGPQLADLIYKSGLKDTPVTSNSA